MTKEENQFDKDIKKFVKWSHKLGEYNLTKCSSGNLSHRINDEIILVSQSRSWLSELRKKNVVALNVKTGEIIQGENPTGELPLHLAVLRQKSNVRTVLHIQSEAATSIACRGLTEFDYNVIIEVPIYIGEVKHLPYMQPGSQELADAVAHAIETANVIQLSNHGQIIIGNSYREVIQRAVFFELACSIILKNSSKNTFLSEEQIRLLKGYR